MSDCETYLTIKIVKDPEMYFGENIYQKECCGMERKIVRMDDMGRIVIPKEFRTRMGIHDYSPLEVETSDCGTYLKISSGHSDSGRLQTKIEAIKDEVAKIQYEYYGGGRVCMTPSVEKFRKILRELDKAAEEISFLKEGVDVGYAEDD